MTITRLKQKNQQELVRRAKAFLNSLPPRPRANRMEIRKEILGLVEAFDALRSLTKIRLRKVTNERASVERLLAYLKLFVGEVVSGKELAVVAATEDPKRRVRQLRVERGYKISTGVNRKDLGPRDYVLESRRPDSGVAGKWRIKNRIKRSDLSAQNKWLDLLKAYIHKEVNLKDLKYVAPDKDRRRIRELRTDHGWRVVTRSTGRPDLPIGSYVLESLKQLPQHDRKIDDKIFDRVLRRDKLKCRKCGWSAKIRNSSERRQYLEVHHIKFHQYGGPGDEKNLISLCNIDHDEVHRKKLVGQKFLTWLRLNS